MANSEWKESEGPVRVICEHCGSDDVYGSATVVWDVEAQMWEIEGFIDAMHCNACDAEYIDTHRIQLVPMNNPPVFRSVRTPGAFGFGGEGAA